MSCLEKHIDEMKSIDMFEGTDFKLAYCQQSVDEKMMAECGFTELCVRAVKELVTFRSNPVSETPDISNAGKHLSAAEFHSILQFAGENLGSDASVEQKQLVLLDARNVYETRIGKFRVPNVKTMDPEIRQYSDLPLWIDEHSDELREKSILMYCTGGIRCEMASAYIRSKGVGFENVFQLFGGIQRYLEQYPDGGFFEGKNFVFDHRISVGSGKKDLVGDCLVCKSNHDDYSSRCRCSRCRMLVLVCSSCQDKPFKEYVCELCQKNNKRCLTAPPGECSTSAAEFKALPRSVELTYRSEPFNNIVSTGGKSRRLRILCLHGFRQNSSNFKGRTASLAKKLKTLAELVFVDAPHEIPLVFQLKCGDPMASSQEDYLPNSNFNFKKRYAWLVSLGANCSTEEHCGTASSPFDPLQYQHQTDGFNKSVERLEAVASQTGGFDGILGFSQGAAMAALFCQHQQKQYGAVPFRFGLFFSGYRAPVSVSNGESVRLPSLHCFGSSSEGHDRQIACPASTELAELFDEGSRVIVKHNMGHIIPTQSPYINQIKNFLSNFRS